MICPLLTIAARALPNQYQNPAQCSESACAWWDHDRARCSIVSIPPELYNLRLALLVQSGHKEMPQGW